MIWTRTVSDLLGGKPSSPLSPRKTWVVQGSLIRSNRALQASLTSGAAGDVLAGVIDHYDGELQLPLQGPDGGQQLGDFTGMVFVEAERSWCSSPQPSQSAYNYRFP